MNPTDIVSSGQGQPFGPSAGGHGAHQASVSPSAAYTEVLSAGMVDIDLSLLFMLGLFLVFAVLLHFIVLKPLIAAQEVRHKGMGGAREDASAFELKAAEMRLAYEQRLGKARQDAVVIRESIKREATSQAHDTTTTVQVETDSRVAAAKVELAKFADRARVEMKTHGDQLAGELAHKLLGGKA